jgi:hypothetical protein
MTDYSTMVVKGEFQVYRRSGGVSGRLVVELMLDPTPDVLKAIDDAVGRGVGQAVLVLGSDLITVSDALGANNGGG